MIIFDSLAIPSEPSSRMLSLKITALLFIIALIASLTPPCNGRRNRHIYTRWSGDCPSEWFTAQFVALADIVVPAELLVPVPDSDYTYFRDIMLFSEEEIKRVTQDAIEFFDTKFGLDFSQSIPNAQGQRAFENAVLEPFIMPSEFRYSININSWLLTGRTTNICFENRDGGFRVIFTGEQMLHGTYGGTDGIPANLGEFVVYGFYNIPTPPRHPVQLRHAL